MASPPVVLGALGISARYALEPVFGAIPMNIADPIARQAKDTPHALALVAGDRMVSYGDFDQAINRTAAGLHAQGVKPQSVVGLSLPASLQHLVTVYALARLGAVHMTLPVSDSPAAHVSLARRFGLWAVVSDAPRNTLPQCRQLEADPAWLEPGAAAPESPAERTHSDSPWKIVLSSGTTADPKAILATHRIEFGWHSRGRPVFAAGSRFLSLVDMNFAYGLRLNMHALNNGACVVLPRAADARSFFEEIDAHGITHLAATPRQLMELVPHLPSTGPRCPNLRYLSAAGSIVPEGLRQRIRSGMTPNLHVKYGSNEIGYVIEAPPELLARYPDVLGRPVAGVRFEIVDEVGQRVRTGEVGRIRFKGEAFPAGYMDNAEATAAAFQDGWFAPGDLAREGPDGEIYFMGRADDMMNFDGVKLYPVDIEARLLQHPSVAEAVAFGLPSERFQDVPAAAVVLRPGSATVTPQALLAFCDDRLGMRAPRIVWVMPELPKNALGKVMRRQLAEKLAQSVSAAIK